MAKSTPPLNEDTFIPSHEAANNGYGQNGYLGPSSDLPGQRTTSGFLPDVTLPKTDHNWQTRDVSKNTYPTTFGHHKPMSGETIPAYNMRPVTTRR